MTLKNLNFVYIEEGRNNMFSKPTLKEVGDKYNKSVAQFILRWLMQIDIVALAKSIHRKKMKENLDIFDFKLSNDDMNKINGLDTNRSLFFLHCEPKMVEWFDEIFARRR